MSTSSVSPFTPVTLNGVSQYSRSAKHSESGRPDRSNSDGAAAKQGLDRASAKEFAGEPSERRSRARKQHAIVRQARKPGAVGHELKSRRSHGRQHLRHIAG